MTKLERYNLIYNTVYIYYFLQCLPQISPYFYKQEIMETMTYGKKPEH